MARKRNPKRDEAKEKYIELEGKAANAEIAALVGVSPNQIRKWKSEDKWQEALKEASKPKKGGQPRNKNAAKPHGDGNNNALKHGAYARADIDELSDEERKVIEETKLDVSENLLSVLKGLKAKESDLERRIRELEKDDCQEMQLEKEITTTVATDEEERITTSKITVNRFEWIGKLNSELDKVRGRILKLIDIMRSYEADRAKIKAFINAEDEGIIDFEG